ncbi:MAG TPA: alpha-amylase family protein [Actinomycetota bacterium]
MDDRWYKNAIIYEIDLRSYADSDGDGIGDLRGLIDRLDYLAALGITCIWLLPFSPSPWRDGGYDVTDHYGVHPELGTPGDFVELVHRAAARGIRVIIDLVLNHTSDEHPWFQAARDPDSPLRDHYVWADTPPDDAERGVVFPGVQESTWTLDERSGKHYFHRFYEFQPDLNVANPDVRAEFRRILGYWIQQGVAGFRMDALPFLIEPAGVERPKPEPHFEYLKELRAFLQWRRGDAVLLGEANVERDRVEDYFTTGGMHMIFNFPLNQLVWLALAKGEAGPIARGLEHTAGIPATDQWATFLRNHDEVDLGRLSEKDRQMVFEAFGPEPSMQLYDRGIRRRLAPMLGGDRRRIEMAMSLLFSLPGTPVILYGDEIGMGDLLSLDEREAVRTPMQWNDEENTGFSTADPDRLARPVISGGDYGYERVNVAAQMRDAGSLLSWMKRLVHTRREAPEVGLGDWELLETGNEHVFGLRAEWEGREVAVYHNLDGEPQKARMGLEPTELSHPLELLGDRDYDEGWSPFELAGYGYRWARVRGVA